MVKRGGSVRITYNVLKDAVNTLCLPNLELVVLKNGVNKNNYAVLINKKEVVRGEPKEILYFLMGMQEMQKGQSKNMSDSCVKKDETNENTVRKMLEDCYVHNSDLCFTVTQSPTMYPEGRTLQLWCKVYEIAGNEDKPDYYGIKIRPVIWNANLHATEKRENTFNVKIDGINGHTTKQQFIEKVINASDSYLMQKYVQEKERGQFWAGDLDYLCNTSKLILKQLGWGGAAYKEKCCAYVRLQVD